MAEPARANMMAVRRSETRNAMRGQSDFLPSWRNRARTAFCAEERTKASFTSKVSRDDRALAAEWVVLGKDYTPAFPPQLFDDEPIRFLRFRGKCKVDGIDAQCGRHLGTRQFDQFDQDIR